MKYNLMKASALVLAVANPISAVIPDFALVKASSGIKMLRDVVEGEQVLSADENRKSLAHGVVVANDPRSRRNSKIQITTPLATINAAPDQVLFDPSKDEWIKAEELTDENMLLGEDMQHQQIVGVKRINDSSMLTRAVKVEATRQLFVDGVLNHNMFNSMWEGIKNVNWMQVGIDMVVEGAKEGGKVVVQEGVKAAIDHMKSSGVDVDTGRDSRGESWHRDKIKNEEMLRDLEVGQPNDVLDLVFGDFNYNPMDYKCPPVQPDPNPSWGEYSVRAGDKPLAVEFSDGSMQYLDPGDSYVSGFNTISKVNGVSVRHPVVATPAPTPSRPAAAPAPAKPAAAPVRPAAAPQPKVAPVQQSPNPAKVAKSAKEVKEAFMSAPSIHRDIIPPAQHKPIFPAPSKPIYVEIRAVPQNQRPSGPTMNIQNFVSHRQQLKQEKSSSHQG